MRKLLSAALAAVLALSASACKSDSDSGATNYKIGVANFLLSGPYFSGMDAAIAAQAKTKGNIEIISTDAGGDAAKLAANVEDLLSRNVDAIIISGGPLESAPAALNAIKAAKKPVVLVDRKFATGEYTSWIGPDNETIGKQDGEFLATRIQQGKVAIIKGGPADNSIGLARTNGLKAVLGTRSGITLVEAPDFGNWGSDGGLTVMEGLLAKHPDLAAVFCENDAMCLGAQRAIAAANKSGQIVLAGVDGQAEALKAILDGSNYVVTGLNSPNVVGKLALDRTVEVLGGAKVEKDTVVPSPQITKDNAAQYLTS
jgi:ribose transport system substrate-binding protein